MNRKQNETVDEYLARREKEREELNAQKRARDIEMGKRHTAERVAKLKRKYPRDIVTEKGVHFRCPVCQKEHTRLYPNDGKDPRLCDECGKQRALEKRYPGHKVKDGKVRFTCVQCNCVFWWGKAATYLDDYIPRFCSDYCKYVSKLKTPPKWTREEWEKIKKWEKQNENKERFSHWHHVFDDTEPDRTFDLGNPQDDANQEALFNALEDYFNDFEDPNRRLNVIHNVFKKLKAIGNECHVEVVQDEQEDTKQIV